MKQREGLYIAGRQRDGMAQETYTTVPLEMDDTYYEVSFPKDAQEGSRSGLKPDPLLTRFLLLVMAPDFNIRSLLYSRLS